MHAAGSAMVMVTVAAAAATHARMRMQGPELEARVAQITARIAEVCGKRGIRIKPFFDDAAYESRTAVYGHVTRSQFKQVRLSVTGACQALRCQPQSCMRSTASTR